MLSRVAVEEVIKIITDLLKFLLVRLLNLETQLLIAKAVEFGDSVFCNNLLTKVIDDQKMLSSFMNSLKT